MTKTTKAKAKTKVWVSSRVVAFITATKTAITVREKIAAAEEVGMEIMEGVEIFRKKSAQFQEGRGNSSRGGSGGKSGKKLEKSIKKVMFKIMNTKYKQFFRIN